MDHILIDTDATGLAVGTEPSVADPTVHIQQLIYQPKRAFKGLLNPYRDIDVSGDYVSEMTEGRLTSLPASSPLLIDCTGYTYLDIFAVGVNTDEYATELTGTTIAAVFFLPETATKENWCPVAIEKYGDTTSAVYPADYGSGIYTFTEYALPWQFLKPMRVVVSGFERVAVMVLSRGVATRLRIGYCLTQ